MLDARHHQVFVTYNSIGHGADWGVEGVVVVAWLMSAHELDRLCVRQITGTATVAATNSARVGEEVNQS